jgi:Transposase DDE domain
VIDLPIQLGAERRLGCRLLAFRCPPEVVRRRRQRLRAEAKRKGRAISAAQWAACSWTVLVTNAPVELLTAEEALIMYGARWQVELLFKAWKGGNGLGALQSERPTKRLCELYAKLLGILVPQWVLLTSGWSEPARSLSKAARWIRQSVIELAGVVSRQRWERLGEYVANIRRELSKTARITKRRKEPSTFPLLGSPDVLNCPIT